MSPDFWNNKKQYHIQIPTTSGTSSPKEVHWSSGTGLKYNS